MHRRVRVLCFALLIAGGTASRASAQAAWSPPAFGWGSGWCQGCYTVMNIDAPNLATEWTGAIDLWAFWCSTGEVVQRADVWYSRPGVFAKQVKSHIEKAHVDRPDVMRYFLSAGCPAVPGDAGLQIVVDEPIPSGTWVMSVVVWHGSVATTQHGLVVVGDGSE
jgi:hypothetical protein